MNRNKGRSATWMSTLQTARSDAVSLTAAKRSNKRPPSNESFCPVKDRCATPSVCSAGRCAEEVNRELQRNGPNTLFIGSTGIVPIASPTVYDHICTYCGKEGHRAHACPVRKEEEDARDRRS